MEATEQGKNRTTTDAAAETERLKEELRREHDMYLRALADFDNYRRRVERERSSAAHSGKRDVILSLLEVMDGFDRALTHIGDSAFIGVGGLAVAAPPTARFARSPRRQSAQKLGRDF